MGNKLANQTVKNEYEGKRNLPSFVPHKAWLLAAGVVEGVRHVNWNRPVFPNYVSWVSIGRNSLILQKRLLRSTCKQSCCINVRDVFKKMSSLKMTLHMLPKCVRKLLLAKPVSWSQSLLGFRLCSGTWEQYLLKPLLLNLPQQEGPPAVSAVGKPELAIHHHLNSQT